MSPSVQNQPASTLGSCLLRSDKLEQAEIKNLLMCFLHVLKSMSEGRRNPLPHYLTLFQSAADLTFAPLAILAILLTMAAISDPN